MPDMVKKEMAELFAKSSARLSEELKYCLRLIILASHYAQWTKATRRRTLPGWLRGEACRWWLVSGIRHFLF